MTNLKIYFHCVVSTLDFYFLPSRTLDRVARMHQYEFQGLTGKKTAEKRLHKVPFYNQNSVKFYRE